MSEEEPAVADVPKIPIVTTCRDCVFAEYEGITQQGCFLGRIDKFEAQGASVTGQDDGTKQYLVIDRFCNAVRKPEYLPSLPLPDLAKLVRNQVTARVAVVIYAGPETLVGHLDASLKSVYAQATQPVKVVVVLDGARFGPAKAVNRIKRLGTPRFLWEVATLMPWEARTKASYQGDARNYGIDVGVSKLDDRKVAFYTAADAGETWPPDYIARIDAAVNDELIPLSVVTRAAEGGPYMVQTKLHNHSQVVGNVGYNVLEKLQYLLPEYGKGFRVMGYEELPNA